jgi:hypothetical protein
MLDRQPDKASTVRHTNPVVSLWQSLLSNTACNRYTLGVLERTTELTISCPGPAAGGSSGGRVGYHTVHLVILCSGQTTGQFDDGQCGPCPCVNQPDTPRDRE